MNEEGTELKYDNKNHDPDNKQYMTKEEIQRLDMPHDYKKKDSPMNGWLNVI